MPFLILFAAREFASKLGRREAGGAIIGSVVKSCEETKFCIRVARLQPGGCGYIVRKHEFSMFGTRQRTT